MKKSGRTQNKKKRKEEDNKYKEQKQKDSKAQKPFAHLQIIHSKKCCLQ